MKKFKFLVVAIIAALGIGMATGPAVSATTNDDVVEVFTELLDQQNDISYDLNYGDAPAQIDALNTSASNIRSAEAKVNAIADSASKAFKPYINNVAEAMEQFAVATENYASALEADDDAAIMTAEANYQTATTDLQSAFDAYDSYLEAHPEEAGDTLLTVFLALFIFTCVLFVGTLLFIILVGRKHKVVELKKERSGLLIASILCVAGAAVTYFSYRSVVVSGGTYYVQWYWLAIGFVAYIAGVISYIKGYNAAKTAGTLSQPAVKVPEIKDSAAVDMAKKK